MCKAFDFHREIFSWPRHRQEQRSENRRLPFGKVHRLIALVEKFIEQDTNLKRSEKLFVLSILYP